MESYSPAVIIETGTVLITAFIMGVIAQYLKQKVDANQTDRHIGWISLAAGFSAMIIVGFLYEYTEISPSFLIAISGLAGWSGIPILSILSVTFEKLLSEAAEKKLGVDISSTTDVKKDGEQQDEWTNSIGSQSE